MRKIEYVRVLDIMTLIGQKDCEIFYIKHVGNFQELSKMACERNCTITSISKKEYEDIERKFKFSEDVMKDVPIEELIGKPEFY